MKSFQSLLIFLLKLSFILFLLAYWAAEEPSEPKPVLPPGNWCRDVEIFFRESVEVPPNSRIIIFEARRQLLTFMEKDETQDWMTAHDDLFLKKITNQTQIIPAKTTIKGRFFNNQRFELFPNPYFEKLRAGHFRERTDYEFCNDLDVIFPDHSIKIIVKTGPCYKYEQQPAVPKK